MSGSVLVPLDGSARARSALGVGALLSTCLACGLHALRAGEPDEDEDALRAALAAEVDATGVQPDRLHVTTTLAPADAIVQVAAALAHPIICLTTRGHGDVRAALLGSVSTAVLARTAAPMVLLGPRAADAPPRALRRILVALDGSLTAEAVLPTAVVWARSLDLPITLLHVAEPTDRRGGEPSDVVVSVAQQYRGAGLRLTTSVRSGQDPAAVIAACADEQPGTLLAMASHGRSGMRRVLLGSVTADVVRRAAAPVLTVRPASLTEAA